MLSKVGSVWGIFHSLWVGRKKVGFPRASESNIRYEGSPRPEPSSLSCFLLPYSYFSSSVHSGFPVLPFTFLCSHFLPPASLSFTGWMGMSLLLPSLFLSLHLSFRVHTSFLILLFFSVPSLPPVFHLAGRRWILVSYFLYLLSHLSSCSFLGRPSFSTSKSGSGLASLLCLLPLPVFTLRQNYP